MTDKIFQEKIKQLEASNDSPNFEESIKILDELRIKLLPNDLVAYLSIKSLENDMKIGKDQDYIRKDISELMQKVINQRLPRSEKISNFTISVVSYTLIPIVPFIANFLNDLPNTGKDIVLSFAMYCISIALSFKTARDRIIGILFSLIIFLLVDQEPKPSAIYATYFFTVVIVSFHLNDRINRHLKGNEPYL